MACLYESLANSAPTHDNLSAAFFAQLRAKDYASMQRIAFKAYRVTRNATWVMFSVVALYLKGADLDLKLAHGMFSRIEARSKEDVELEIQILSAQGRIEQVLELLETPLAKTVLMKTDLLARKVQYLRELKRPVEALEICREWLIAQ